MVLRHVGEAEPGQRRLEPQRHVVEHELPLDTHLQLALRLLELPGVQAAIGRQAHVDAIVGGQVLGVTAVADARNTGDPTTAMRMSGPMRTATMSLATCSPSRTPAS